MPEIAFAGTDGAKATLDTSGIDVHPDAKPAWTVRDNAHVILDIAEDGLSATAKRVADGTAHVTVQVTDRDGYTVTGQSLVVVRLNADGEADVTWTDPTPAPPAVTATTSIFPHPANVPSAPEVLQARPSEDPGVTTLQGASVHLETADDGTEPHIVDVDEDGNVKPAGPTGHTASPDTLVSTPVSSALPSTTPDNAPEASPVDTSAGATPATEVDGVPVPESTPDPEAAVSPSTGDTAGEAPSVGVPAA